MEESFEYEETTIFNYYALSLKGGWYTADGQVTESIEFAVLFYSKESAIAFRQQHDPIQKVDCSQLQIVRILVADAE